MNIKNIEIETPDGKAFVYDMYISELGFLMIKLYFPDLGIWKGYNLGNIIGQLSNKNINLKEEIGKKINILK